MKAEKNHCQLGEQDVVSGSVQPTYIKSACSIYRNDDYVEPTHGYATKPKPNPSCLICSNVCCFR